MMFFDVKRVLLIVAAIVGILVVVIIGFLYAGGIISFDSQDDPYQGFVDERYLTSSALSVKGSPVDADTLETLNDTDSIKVVPDAATSPGNDPADDGDADADADAAAGTDAAAEDIKVRVLLFLDTGELVADGIAFRKNNKFSLTKSFDMMGVKTASDFPHMNRDRDLLSYNEVDAILADGGYFRLVAGDRYITRKLVPIVPVLIN
jgi:hypothetical protein